MLSKDFLSEKAIYELKKIKEIKQELDEDDSIYKTSDKKKDKTYDFQKFTTIRFFGGEI